MSQPNTTKHKKKESLNDEHIKEGLIVWLQKKHKNTQTHTQNMLLKISY